MSEIPTFDVRGTILHRAEYARPGLFVTEQSVRTLESRSVEEATAEAPESAICFSLYEVETAFVTIGGATHRVEGPKIDESNRYWLGGVVHTLEAIDAAIGLGSPLMILRDNMRSNGWRRVIQSPVGNWQPFGDLDVVLDPR